MEALKGLVYRSRALASFDQAQLKSLADHAAANNEDLGITGYLYYENGYFLQYIEGPPTLLEDLMMKIAEDPRHQVLSVLRSEELGQRKFPTWQMRWLSQSVLVSIRMEHILSDFLVMLEENTVERSIRNEKNVWEMVDQISRFQGIG